MNANTVALATAALAIALAATACKWPTENAADNNVQGQATALPGASGGARDNVAAEITGAGATFIYPLLSKWSADYNKATGNKVNYQSIGSGGGIA
ncbi:MAG: substrate-binding domain-containing protein, partial [Pseudomonadota bacterium]|nr:substrate-binding domain-containing protein [Pseudomonadota bacterium]